MRFLIITALFLTLLTAQNRVALLIGNSDYQHISDLKDMSGKLGSLQQTLEGLGFNVKRKKNLNAKELKRAIDNFRDRLARNPNNIGFLYYSGHGCQLDNVGYLVPTNVDTQKKIDIEYDALNIDKMLKILESANNRLNMLFLDACRDIPSGVRGGTKGLGQAPLTPKGTLIVYATEAKKTANDNARFIDSLIKYIQEPNRNIRDIADDISNEVADQTRENQIPEVFSKRLPTPMIVLKSGGYVPPTPRPTAKPIGSKWITPTNKLLTWEKAKKICRDNGGRLPTREELRRVVTDCGGIPTQEFFGKDAQKNMENTRYQSCYEKKGFTSGNYWSSSTTTDASVSYAWYVYFGNGNDLLFRKTHESYVRCVRGGQ